MSRLETALTAWIAFHAQLGVDVDAFFLPPASEAQIAEVEEQIGYRLPEDLRELYKITNGQWNTYDGDSSVLDVDRDQRWAPLFGNYDFLPLHEALEKYQFYLESYTSEKEFNKKYYAANPDKTYVPTVWEVREGDSVDEAGWNPSWFTFAGSDANTYSVDLSPPHGGNPGQVVLHGADEWILQVVGHSITDMMEQAVTHLSSDEEHRYQYSEKEGKYMASVYFNMDWRAEVYTSPPETEMPAAYTSWMEETEQAADLQREQMDVWLQGRNIQEDQRNALIQWFSLALLDNPHMTPPPEVMMEMAQMSESQEDTPAQMMLSASAYRQQDQGTAELQQHLAALARVYFSMGMPLTAFNIDMSIEDAVSLYHQYKLESSLWTEADFENMKKLEQEIKNLPLQANGSFSIYTSDSTMTICTSSFDEQTYKSSEICHEVDLSVL